MFKFYSIPDLSTLEKIIGEKPSLKFSSAFNLNDPFELKFNLTIDPFADGHENAFLKAHPGSTAEDFKDWQEQVKDNGGFEWYEEQKHRALLSQKITLCSFTQKKSNNLMWSHYTDNHQGICVEYSEKLFENLPKHDKFLLQGKVQYSGLPPEVDSLDELKSKLQKITLNKQSEWKYEQEHRVILLSDNETDFVSIKPKYIKAVYIGSRASEEIISKTVDICKKNKYECYQGISLGNTYKVEFKKHRDGTIYMRSFWS